MKPMRWVSTCQNRHALVPASVTLLTARRIMGTRPEPQKIVSVLQNLEALENTRFLATTKTSKQASSPHEQTENSENWWVEADAEGLDIGCCFQ